MQVTWLDYTMAFLINYPIVLIPVMIYVVYLFLSRERIISRLDDLRDQNNSLIVNSSEINRQNDEKEEKIETLRKLLRDYQNKESQLPSS